MIVDQTAEMKVTYKILPILSIQLN